MQYPMQEALYDAAGMQISMCKLTWSASTMSMAKFASSPTNLQRDVHPNPCKALGVLTVQASLEPFGTACIAQKD